MVHLGVVTDHVIDFFRIYDGADIGQELISERLFDRVNEGYFFIQNQIGVVGGALIGGIAMKIPDIPIGYAHSKNSIRYFDGFHCSLLFKDCRVNCITPPPYPSRHPPHSCMPSFAHSLEAMVGSPQRSQGFDGSI